MYIYRCFLNFYQLLETPTRWYSTIDCIWWYNCYHPTRKNQWKNISNWWMEQFFRPSQLTGWLCHDVWIRWSSTFNMIIFDHSRSEVTHDFDISEEEDQNALRTDNPAFELTLTPRNNNHQQIASVMFNTSFYIYLLQIIFLLTSINPLSIVFQFILGRFAKHYLPKHVHHGQIHDSLH